MPTTDRRRLDLVCFSYLADAQVLHVDTYPPANSGTVVEQTSASIAGDGPLAAALASELGLRVGLIANPIGTDPAGHRVLAWLERARISHRIARADAIATPQLTVIADAGTRTWFASTQHVSADLLAAELGLLTDARLVYVDCYRLLAAAATRVVAAATNTPLLLNLGGDPLDDQLARRARNRRVWAVQTSIDEDRADEAVGVAEELFARVQPDAVVVTLGRLGAGNDARTRPPGAGAAGTDDHAHPRCRRRVQHRIPPRDADRRRRSRGATGRLRRRNRTLRRTVRRGATPVAC